MSELTIISASISVFLLTYLLHSTLTTCVAAFVMHRLGRIVNPELRVLVWKMVLLLPIGTTSAVTILEFPHCGLLLPIASAGADVRPESLASPPAISKGAFPMERDPARFRARESSGAALEQSTAEASDELFVSNALANPASGVSGWLLFVGFWGLGVFMGLGVLAVQLRRLKLLRQRSSAVTNFEVCESLKQLKQKLKVFDQVDLLQVSELPGPLTAGIRRPFILIPIDMCQTSPAARSSQGQLSDAERDALLAHELVHIARGDALWNLIIQGICRLFFMQPLNCLVGKQLRQQMDFVADSDAARALGQRIGLAQCLLRLGERMSQRPRTSASCVLTAGMASFRSTLGRRVETLMDESNSLPALARRHQLAALAVMVSSAIFAASVLPRATAGVSDSPISNSTNLKRNISMKKHLTAFALLAGISMPAIADEPQQKSDTSAVKVPLKTTPDELPKGMHKFNGMLVGRMAAKDIERGTFLVQVDAVSRVWRNSSAEDPQSIVGKTVEVNGVFGKFLDVLVVTRIGETVEFECKHDGDQLKFPGELLRKVAPYKPEDYPKLPEEFRGFQGAVLADVVKKDAESLELIVKVIKVLEPWKESTAKQPKSIEGKTLMLAGFWNRKDDYHQLKAGERVELGMKHIGMRTDHMTVAEFVRKAGGETDREAMKKEAVTVEDGLTPALRGFRGMLVGRLVAKDIERGTFTITVDAVPRVWQNNEARNPKSIIGQNAEAGGVTGKMLDALIVARVGETIEFGALHDGGDRVRVGEVLRKVAPVKPGDYPELPQEFRGFKGMIVGKVIKKDDHLMELIVEVSQVQRAFDGSRAKNAEAIVGQTVMLAGFWQRKDAYQSIRTGDVIECGVDHKQQLSDMLTVIETVRKVEK